MAFVLEDRVVETANNPGQGDFELLGAVENNQTFVAGIGNGNTTRYLAVGAEGAEIGIAQVQAGSPDRLLRPGTVKNMDGTTTPVNFTGTVTVACIASIEDVLWLGENGDLPARGGRDLGTTGDPWRNLFLSGTARLGRPSKVSDLNDITETRFFTTSVTASNIPPGATPTGVGLSIARDTSANDHVQVYFVTTSGSLTGGVWARAGRENWTEGAPDDWWRFVMLGPNGGNVVGAVSEDDGNPTGAIIERGENSNGQYTKYADGTMICRGNGFEDRTSDGVAVTPVVFPAEFSSVPSTSATMRTTVPENAITISTSGTNRTTGFEVRINRINATPTGYAYISVGNWF